MKYISIKIATKNREATFKLENFVADFLFHGFFTTSTTPKVIGINEIRVSTRKSIVEG